MHPDNRYRIHYKFLVIKENVFIKATTFHNGNFDPESDSGKMWLAHQAAEGYKFSNQYTDYNMAKHEIDQPIVLTVEKV